MSGAPSPPIKKNPKLEEGDMYLRGHAETTCIDYFKSINFTVSFILSALH